MILKVIYKIYSSEKHMDTNKGVGGESRDAIFLKVCGRFESENIIV